MKPQESSLTRLRAVLNGQVFEELTSRDGIANLRCSMEQALAFLSALRDGAGFEICTMITAVDHGDSDPVVPGQRFDLIWQLQSVQHRDRVRLHAWVPGEEPGEDNFTAPSVTALWPGAAYYERECYDMFGLQFEGHENLRRILMPEPYEHFPLRKEFPHGGIEPDKLYKAWDRSRRLANGENA